MNWLDQMRQVCEGINALRAAIADGYRTADGVRAAGYVDEAKSLIEMTYDLLRREDRWAKRGPVRRIVPIPPKALSGDETKRRMAKSNSDRAALHRGMTAPSRVSGEPQPSSPMTTYGDSGFIWGGDKGRAW